MAADADQLYNAALTLSANERAALTDRLVASLGHNIPQDCEQAQIDEVHRRIDQVETGEVELIPGEQVLRRARALLTSLSQNS